MSLGLARWHVIAESNFAWERDALEWLREQLPDRDPWHVWTNFEFIDDEGRVNEVDALVLSPAGLFLVEIKSRPGALNGDSHTWTWETDGRTLTVDNPLPLTNRKSKRLVSLLRRQAAVTKAKIKVPFVEPLVFLSSTSLNCKLQGTARAGIFLRGRPGHEKDDGIVAALRDGMRAADGPPIDAAQVRAISRGLEQAGIRQSNKHRQVGDYLLVKLIAEGDGYQDWMSAHVALPNDVRRVRIYTLGKTASPEARAALQRQAEREYEILKGIEHPGVLRPALYSQTERGPALTYDYDPQALRLDHLLRDRGTSLTVSQRLQLVRDIAEVLKHAHAKRLYHRALGPQSILVSGIESGALRVHLMNWQTASRGGSSLSTVHRTTGTQHVEAYVEDLGLLYLAPETTRADPSHGAELDVFSLGCIAYQVFCGQLPAQSPLEMAEKLRAGPGLRLSDVLDGCGPRLQDLVQFATVPDVSARTESITTFLGELDGVEDELTTPDPETTVDPGSARAKGDRIEGGFTVVRRLGRGSSSDALLVCEDGSSEELVLKVATDATHNEHLVAEGEAIGKLRHPNIVVHRRTLQVAGRTALLLESAGTATLAEEIKREGRLSLQMLQRYGDELIDAVRHLEDRGVTHRDIKPDNVGLARASNGRLLAVLFDFSLSRAPPENLSAGTQHYLDPFLSARPRRVWDLYAERYALAVTLYEMAVGKLPRWGDGRTAPSMLPPDTEVTLDVEAFSPAIREPLAAFFLQALKHDFRQRFDNAEEMLHTWRRVFERAVTVHPTQPNGFDLVAQVASANTTMAELGYSVEAQDVLDKMSVHNARELLAIDRLRIRYLKGVGDKVRREIREKAKLLAQLRPDLAQGRETLHDEPEETAAEDPPATDRAVSVNELANLLLLRRPAASDVAGEAALAYFLGIERNDGDVNARRPAASKSTPPLVWPTRGDAATAAGIDRTAFSDALLRARERWLKNPAFTDLRAQLAALLPSQGQVMTAPEAALALLALRGCALQHDDERLTLSLAVLRAAVEAEANTAAPRFQVYDHAPAPLLATDAPWADYARQLGAIADTCAMAEPLLPPARVLQALAAVRPTSLTPGADFDTDDNADETIDTDEANASNVAAMPVTRMLRLAASASRHAALSSRQELYPRGMPALQALRQSAGALANVPVLKVDKLRQRVHGRYPEAAALPDRPELDRLLEDAGVPLQWNPAADDGLGGYIRPAGQGDLTVGPSTLFSRQPTRDGSSGPSETALVHAQALEERLQRTLKLGGLLTLTVEPRRTCHAETELLRRFGADSGSTHPVQRLSIDALLLRHLREQAEAAKVDWNRVLAADAAERDSRDWANLQRLVQRTLPALRLALLQATQPLLVVYTGLLARYGLMHLLVELESAAGRPGHTPAAWLLLPTHQAGRATIDGTTVPLVHAGHIVPVPQAWIENRHRTHDHA